MKTKERINKAEALNFLLSHIIVERRESLVLDQFGLFKLNSIAQRAVDAINQSNEVIPHEVIENLADKYLRSE